MQPVMKQCDDEQQNDSAATLSLWQVVCSVFAAGFGVQSKENKVRDFTHGKPLQFVIAGLLFTIGFLIMLISIVNMIV